MARYGAGAAPCSLPSAKNRAAATASSQFSSSGARETLTDPFRTRAAQRSDSARKSADSNMASAMPSEKASAPPIMRFWLSGFSMMSFSALAGPIRRGSR